jgi:hypothetical protein
MPGVLDLVPNIAALYHARVPSDGFARTPIAIDEAPTHTMRARPRPPRPTTTTASNQIRNVGTRNKVAYWVGTWLFFFLPQEENNGTQADAEGDDLHEFHSRDEDTKR